MLSCASWPEMGCKGLLRTYHKSNFWDFACKDPHVIGICHSSRVLEIKCIETRPRCFSRGGDEASCARNHGPILRASVRVCGFSKAPYIATNWAVFIVMTETIPSLIRRANDTFWVWSFYLWSVISRVHDFSLETLEMFDLKYFWQKKKSPTRPKHSRVPKMNIYLHFNLNYV